MFKYCMEFLRQWKNQEMIERVTILSNFTNRNVGRKACFALDHYKCRIKVDHEQNS